MAFGLENFLFDQKVEGKFSLSRTAVLKNVGLSILVEDEKVIKRIIVLCRWHLSLILLAMCMDFDRSWYFAAGCLIFFFSSMLSQLGYR